MTGMAHIRSSSLFVSPIVCFLSLYVCLCLFRCVLCLLRCDHPVDGAGFFSFMTFLWLTPLVSLARRKGQLLLDDVWPVSQRECCHHNSLRWFWHQCFIIPAACEHPNTNHLLLLLPRLASLWEEEQRSKGSEASLCSVVWAFCRTRLLLSILCLTITQLAGFSGPVSLTPVRTVNPSLSTSRSLWLSVSLLI